MTWLKYLCDGPSSHLSPLTVGHHRWRCNNTFPSFPVFAALRESPNPIPVHSLMLSSHLFFCLPLLLAPSLSLAELSSPCQRILRCGHTIWVPVSLLCLWLGDHHALQLHSGFCSEPPRSSHGLCRKCSEVSYSISSQELDAAGISRRGSWDWIFVL